jgi:hypothetical protein
MALLLDSNFCVSCLRFCSKIQKQVQLSAKDLLRRCDPSVFKSYLFWRKRTSRIKKESAIEAYWKRTSMYYHNVVGHAMGNDVLKDIRNVCCCTALCVIELTVGEVDPKSRT